MSVSEDSVETEPEVLDFDSIVEEHSLSLSRENVRD